MASFTDFDEFEKRFRHDYQARPAKINEPGNYDSAEPPSDTGGLLHDA